MESLEIIKIAANALNDKKARDITAANIGDLTVLTEYFLIATATSSTHLRALCDEVEDKLSLSGLKPHHIEGRSTGWLVLDYGAVIIHIFSKTDREFYGLDKMWSDGKQLDLSDILTKPKED